MIRWEANIDTELRWAPGWPTAQISSGCGTGAQDLTASQLRKLAITALLIVHELEESR